MTKFRKKPVVIEAMQVVPVDDVKGRSTLHTWLHEMKKQNNSRPWYEDGRPGEITISTLEGDMLARVGDWIILGVAGEIYPCKPEVFEQTYEAVE